LGQRPNDSEILRFSDKIDTDRMYELVIHLGLVNNEWKDMKWDHQYSIGVAKFLILIQWRERKTGIFRDLSKAVTEMGVTTHKLCQVGTELLNTI
jgi:hypothetical protein